MLWVRTQAESLSIVRVYAHTRTPLRQRLRQPDMETWQMKCRNCNGVFQGNSSQRESYLKQYFQPSAPALRRPRLLAGWSCTEVASTFSGARNASRKKDPRHPKTSPPLGVETPWVTPVHQAKAGHSHDSLSLSLSPSLSATNTAVKGQHKYRASLGSRL